MNLEKKGKTILYWKNLVLQQKQHEIEKNKSNEISFKEIVKLSKFNIQNEKK